MRRFASLLLAGLLAGCAADRVAPHAKAMETAVTGFQADLSKFHDMMKLEQAGKADLAKSEADSTAETNLAVLRAQTEWALRSANGPADIFKTLQAQADAGAVSATAATPPSTAAMSTDKLADVAKSLHAIAQDPDGKADLEFLINYATTIKKQMDAAAAAAKPVATPAAPAPAPAQ